MPAFHRSLNLFNAPNERFVYSIGLAILPILFTCVRLATADPLGYLGDACDAYYVGLDFPKLTTPQWYGDDEVDAIVILSIDDLRDPGQYETYLRPILNRLKSIDGRAALSIFANALDPTDARLQKFLDEGVSIEAHTNDHPCPLLQGGDFEKSKRTYDDCIDTLAKIAPSDPGTLAVAYRMPCCDSKNTPSPRFWKEIFERKTPGGNYLKVDSSVFNITTSDDTQLSKEITLYKGEERFRRYVPFPSYVNTIENYPYPYVIGKQCWEFPCVVPSDWEAQNLQQPNNPDTVRDMKRALDATVSKKGVMTLCFHPWGWIRNDQIVELIDHAQETYGKRVKFVNIRDAYDRLNVHLLDGHPIRDDNGETGVRLLDINRDGFLDVVIPQEEGRLRTRVWDNRSRKWHDTTSHITDQRLAFGLINNRVVMLGSEKTSELATGPDPSQLRSYLYEPEAGWSANSEEIPAAQYFRLLDFNGDGNSELIVMNQGETTVFHHSDGGWIAAKEALPKGIQIWTKSGGDGGTRFRDINKDGRLDIVFSNGRKFAVHLYQSPETSLNKGHRGAATWSPAVISGKSGDAGTLPAIVRSDGTDNGAWFHSDHMWVQNEQTDRLDANVDRVSFAKMLGEQAADAKEEEKDAAVFPPAKTVEEALAAFAKRPDMRIELVACEPQIVDPVAFDWGGDGSLWVVEMRDYPNGILWYKQGDPIGKAGGRIKRLTDTDGDGTFETSTIFLDDIPFPTGIKAWRKGVLVTSAPHVFYAEDTDGDGKADRQEILLEGFVEGNQQHRVNGMRWGIDQWLYLANGESGGTVRSRKTNETVEIRGRDLCLQPDLGHVKTQSGQTQCGRSRDDHGNWFGGNNSNPVWHYVLDEQYLNRNGHYAPPPANHIVGAVPGAAPVFPTSKTLARFNDFDRANRYTSACSPEVFREDCNFDRDSRRFVYICEPVHNLVGREVLTDDGLTFRSQRDPAEEASEPIASSDSWFRPVMARTGPDGALWVADMYRLVIEHPEWVPNHWQQKLNMRDGEDKGRIYRVVFADIAERFSGPAWDKLSDQSTAELVASLDTSNGTLRDMVHQQLYWEQDSSAEAPLKQLLTNGRWPAAGPHALYLLESLGALDIDTLMNAITKPTSLQRHAIKIAEHFPPAAAGWDQVANAIVELSAKRPQGGEPLRTLQQVAYTLGAFRVPATGPALANIAIDYVDDPFMVASVMGSVNEDNIATILDGVLHSPDSPDTLISDLLAMATAWEQWPVLESAIRDLSAVDPKQRMVTTGRLLNLLPKRDASKKGVLNKETQQAMAQTVDLARRRIKDPNADLQERVTAISLLGCLASDITDDTAILLALLTPQFEREVQLAAVQQLNQLSDPAIGQELLRCWPTLTPAIRRPVLDMIVSRESWLPSLIQSMESGVLSPSLLDAQHRQRLLTCKSLAIREAAARLLASDPLSSRTEIIETYSAFQAEDANASRGKEHFAKSCSNCHRLDGVGHVVGPDLGALTDKSVSAMLTAILDPNRAIEDRYLNYIVITDQGRQYSGLLASETANAITLNAGGGQHHQILRDDIDELQATGISLMPEGLERDVSPKNMADIIAYLQSLSAPHKTFPGNRPQLAPVRDDGSIRLFAMHAKIYGPSLQFEPKYRNLGKWSDASDRAVWRIHVQNPGEYAVRVDYACDPESGGNRLQITTQDQKLSAVVRSTQGWDDYQTRQLGKLTLPAGTLEITLKADSDIHHFLGDFRTLILEPR